MKLLTVQDGRMHRSKILILIAPAREQNSFDVENFGKRNGVLVTFIDLHAFIALLQACIA